MPGLPDSGGEFFVYSADAARRARPDCGSTAPRSARSRRRPASTIAGTSSASRSCTTRSSRRARSSSRAISRSGTGSSSTSSTRWPCTRRCRSTTSRASPPASRRLGRVIHLTFFSEEKARRLGVLRRHARHPARHDGHRGQAGRCHHAGAWRLCRQSRGVRASGSPPTGRRRQPDRGTSGPGGVTRRVTGTAGLTPWCAAATSWSPRAGPTPSSPAGCTSACSRSTRACRSSARTSRGSWRAA